MNMIFLFLFMSVMAQSIFVQVRCMDDADNENLKIYEDLARKSEKFYNPQ